MKTKFAVIITKREKGYVAYVPELYGCGANAGSVNELLRRTKKSIRRYPKTYEDLSADFVGVYVVTFKKGNFCVAVRKDKDGYYFASVPSLSGCFTQARTLNKLMKYVKEVIALCLYDVKNFKGDNFVGVQSVEV